MASAAALEISGHGLARIISICCLEHPAARRDLPAAAQGVQPMSGHRKDVAQRQRDKEHRNHHLDHGDSPFAGSEVCETRVHFPPALAEDIPGAPDECLVAWEHASV
jgi:hypothetical protein